MRRKLSSVALATTALVAGILACGKDDYDLKDMPGTGYDYSFIQRSSGREHDRDITFLVNRTKEFPNGSVLVLRGNYLNIGSEAPEFLWDARGSSIFSQDEARRNYDFLANTRNDISSISLLDMVNDKAYTAHMSRFVTEWWGDADWRAITVNDGPLMVRLSGKGKHLGIEDQQVFAVAIPKNSVDKSSFYDQNNAGSIRRNLEDVAGTLENSDFLHPDFNMLITTRDSDKFFDWLGLETTAAKAELYNGSVEYRISSSYFGPDNEPFAGTGGVFRQTLYGHQGAPDKSNKAGSALNSVTLELLDPATGQYIPRAKLVVHHPTWSAQVEYQFYQLNPDGTMIQRAALQRSYKDASLKDSEGVTVQDVGFNNYRTKGDLGFAQQFFALMGGQITPLGFDYKRAFTEYATDIVSIAAGTVSGMNPELVASLNVDADATILNVIDAARTIFGVEPPVEFRALEAQQRLANDSVLSVDEYLSN